MLTLEITEAARRIGTLLRETGETVAVAEGSAGGLVSAAHAVDFGRLGLLHGWHRHLHGNGKPGLDGG
jgi:hypothetical protein